MRLAAGLGLDFLVLDQTRADIAVPVAKVIVPGLRLGLRQRTVSEAELNPLHLIP